MLRIICPKIGRREDPTEGSKKKPGEGHRHLKQRHLLISNPDPAVHVRLLEILSSPDQFQGPREAIEAEELRLPVAQGACRGGGGCAVAPSDLPGQGGDWGMPLVDFTI